MTSGTDDVLTAHTYRILIVDDDRDVRSYIRRMLDDLDLPRPVAVLEAADEQSALDVMRSTYVDLVLLDIFLASGSSTGFELLSSLARQGCCAKIVMMTHYDTSRHFDRIMRVVTSIEQPQVIKFLKTEELAMFLPDILTGCLVDFVNCGVTTEGLDFVAGLIEKRRKRYTHTTNVLRSGRSEIAVEVERLCRKVFGSTNGQPRSTRVRVRLQPFDHRGLSAAVLVKAVVTTTIDGSSRGPKNDFECILKMGPTADIQIEVARYHEYVRFGVQLIQRVELLESAADQGIGAIAYSFAGGVYGRTLTSLDDLLRNDTEQAKIVIASLFGSTNWYSVRAPDGAIRAHIDRSFRVNVASAIERNTDTLANLAHENTFLRFRLGSRGADSTLQVSGGPALLLPGTNFLGKGWHLRPFARCLVHGDMHGGNVMVEIGPPSDWPGEVADAPMVMKRVCLIDYHSAGPGPRCLDAVALESSVRIAHSEELGGDAAKDGTLAGADLHSAMTLVVRQYDTELQLYNRLLGPHPSAVPAASWCQLAGTIIKGLRDGFTEEEVSMEEYMQTALLYAVRQLAYDLSPIVRVRLCTWMAALYSIGKEIFFDKENVG